MGMLNLYSHPVYHNSLFLYSWTFWSQQVAPGLLEQSGAGIWSRWQPCWELWGTRNPARCITGRSRSTDRSSQILALRKLSDHQELCKAETTMWEASSDSNVDMRPPCDNLENNLCHAHMIWIRIPPKGLFQMGTLILPCLSSRLVYLIVSAARCLQAVGCVLFTCCGLEWEHSGSQLYSLCHVC